MSRHREVLEATAAEIQEDRERFSFVRGFATQDILCLDVKAKERIGQ
jgi:hypothetical protein